jgi:hypothetical protein
MLGQLQMSTPEAIAAYNELSESVFGLRKWRWKSADKNKVSSLQQAIKTIVSRYWDTQNAEENTLDSRKDACKT